ncbi:MAG: hypothetical protein JW717_02110 [Marinilabiliaceae bacterium]|nr:hypothetical protein [Marinilabiliaceae bacterium]
MRKLLIILISMLLTSSLMAQQLVEWPEITQINKPWTRWWWMGSAVNEKDLTLLMEQYKEAGLGGMEITAIYGVRGEEDKFINYLSPRWCEVFQHTLNEAGRLNLGIDLANASGWPFGGPWVTPEDACKTLEIKTYSLKSGQKLDEPISLTQKPLLRLAGPLKPNWKELKEPISKTTDLQAKALDQVRFEKKLPLIALIAYSDKGISTDLISHINNDGTLNWTAPEGNWTIYALFQGWHGKMVERAGPGGEGDVIDHFSKQATERYLSFFDEKFKNMNLTNLRGYFNDSYEVDDARGEANWTPNFFSEFQQRRGYDLKPFIPALLGKMEPDTNMRVLCDYRETISDLLLENYTQEWHKWANKQGKIIRNQAHGSPANILDLYAATDIPEIEGEHIPSIKFASSAAHATGKQLTASESATWLNQHFKSTLSDAKHALDLLMLGGVNHIFYHGTSYSPKNAAWPGWLFYAAVHFNPNNTFWNDFSVLNNYIAHCQSFLQKGVPDNDVLLYFPIYDAWSDTKSLSMPHFNGYRKMPENWSVKQIAEEMVEKGYSWDYISDKQISNLICEGNIIKSNNAAYQTILVPQTSFMPAKTLQYLIKLAGSGATILIQNKLPQLSGFGNLQQLTDQLQFLKEDLLFQNNKNDSTQIANIGNGKIIIGTNLLQLMNAAKVSRETMTDNHLQFIRRKIDDNYFYFITNHSNELIEKNITLSHSFNYAAALNPMTNEKGIIKIKNESKHGSEIYLSIKPNETLLIIGSNTAIEGDKYNFYSTNENSKELKGNWKISFEKGGPVTPNSTTTRKLSSWTEFEGDSYKNFSGTAKYELSFKNPELKSDKLELSLGKVCEYADVYLNGKLLAKLIGPDYKVILDSNLLLPENKLSITVTNSMANRIAYMDRNNIEWRKFYNTNFQTRIVKDKGNDGYFSAANWTPEESGLFGPVTLTELTIIDK